MLAALLNIPRDENDMGRWSFHHVDSHRRIVQAIQAQKGVYLQDYLIDPINENDIQNWLERHQQYHNDMNGALGLQGSDLDSVNWQNERERQSWFYSQYLEHYDCEGVLKI